LKNLFASKRESRVISERKEYSTQKEIKKKTKGGRGREEEMKDEADHENSWVFIRKPPLDNN
jgi:hypothetical protein